MFICYLFVYFILKENIKVFNFFLYMNSSSSSFVQPSFPNYDNIEERKREQTSEKNHPSTPMQRTGNFEIREDENSNIISKFVEYAKKNNPKLYILTPSYNSTVHNNYVQSLLQTVHFFNALKFPFEILFTRNDSLVTRARNNLIAKAMYDTEMTHVIFIDSDISWVPLDIIKLILSEQPLIGGIYPLKKYNWENLLNSQEGGGFDFVKNTIDKKNESFLKDIMSNEDAIRCNMVRYNLNYLGANAKIEKNLLKLLHIPTGFMMIKRETLNEMILHFPETKYEDDTGTLSAHENKYAYALFDCKVVDGRYLSEDWYFCHRWGTLGNDIYADISINLNHCGIEEFKGCYFSSLLAMN